MKSRVENIMENWNEEGAFREWYAVDVMRPNEDAKQPMKVTRTFVGDRERAAKIAAERVTALNLLDPTGSCPAEPGEFGEAPFYRMTAVSPEVAHDYFAGILAGLEHPGRMLTMAEAAKRYGVTKQSVHERIRRGRIAAEEVGGAWRVLDASMRLWTPER